LAFDLDLFNFNFNFLAVQVDWKVNLVKVRQVQKLLRHLQGLGEKKEREKMGLLP
jgi:hypothetical protein